MEKRSWTLEKKAKKKREERGKGFLRENLEKGDGLKLWILDFL